MAVSRPILVAVLGLLLVTATFMATRNAHQASEPTQAAAGQPVNQGAGPKDKAAAKPDPPAVKRGETHATAATDAREPARSARERHGVSKPAAVSRAIAHGRLVVLAFFQTRGADDTATKEAVARLRHRHLALVYTDSIDRIGRYGRVVGKLDIHQAPAVVIVGSDRHARLVEGYIDPESLAQEVSDARK